MQRKYGLLAAMALATSAPIAASAAEAGFYFGALAGQASYDVEQEEFDTAFIIGLDEVGILVFDGESELDDSDTAFGAVAGYRFNPYIAVEAAYIDLGSVEYEAEAEVFVSGLGFDTWAGGASLESTGPALSALGIWPVSESFDLYARVGFFFSDTELEISIEDESDSVSGTDQDVFYGIGAGWNIGDHWTLRLDYQQFKDVGNDDDTGEFDVDAWQLGVLFRI